MDPENYPDRSAAAAATIGSTIESVFVAGFASAGDGGAALYIRVASEPSHAGKFRSTDRFLPSGSTDPLNGGWWSIAQKDLNPLQFGSTGDGATDDTATFVDALNAAAFFQLPLGIPGGCTFYIPEIASATLPSFIHMVGSDRSTSVLDAGAEWPVPTSPRPALSKKRFNLVNHQILRVSNLKLTHFNHTFFVRDDAAGSPVTCISELTFNNVWWHECYSAATTTTNQRSARLDLTIGEIRVQDCLSTCMQFNMMLAGIVGRAHIDGNDVIDLDRTDLLPEGSTHMGNCYGFYIGSGESEELDETQGQYIVTNNYFRNLHTNSTNPASGSGDVNAIVLQGGRTIITSNIIDNVTSAASVGCEGIYTKCRRSVVSNNVLRNAGTEQAAINIKRRSGDNLVKNNYVYWTSSYTEGSQRHGIHVEGDRADVSGNWIVGAVGMGIDFQGLDRNLVTINDNYVEMAGTGHGILITYSVQQRLEVTRNTVRFANIAATGDVFGIHWKHVDASDTVSRDAYFCDNKVLIESTVTGLANAMCMRIERQAPIENLSVSGNLLLNDASATTKRWFAISFSSKTISLLRVISNIFKPASSLNVVLNLANMGGRFELRDNSGFVTRDSGTATMNNATTKTIVPALTSIGSISGLPTTSIPYPGIRAQPVGPNGYGAANKMWVSATSTASGFVVSTDVNVGTTDVVIAWEAAREVWDIP